MSQLSSLPCEFPVLVQTLCPCDSQSLGIMACGCHRSWGLVCMPYLLKGRNLGSILLNMNSMSHVTVNLREWPCGTETASIGGLEAHDKTTVQ